MHPIDSGEGRATKSLLAINVAIFVLTEFLLAAPNRFALMAVFGLSPGGLGSGWLWQLVTYQFFHGNTLHLVMNMIGLWFAGRELERTIGSRWFLIVYFTSGIVGGLAQILFSGSTTLLIGASGSVFGILVALTALLPNLPVTALLFFVLPLRMKAKTLGFLVVGSSLAMWLLGFEPGIGHLAHLGGALTGFLFARGLLLTGGRTGALHPQPRVFTTSPRTGEVRGDATRRNAPIFTVVPPPGGGTAGVEQVLEKLLRGGIDALTREEHRILEASRRDRPRRWR